MVEKVIFLGFISRCHVVHLHASIAISKLPQEEKKPLHRKGTCYLLVWEKQTCKQLNPVIPSPVGELYRNRDFPDLHRWGLPGESTVWPLDQHRRMSQVIPVSGVPEVISSFIHICWSKLNMVSLTINKSKKEEISQNHPDAPDAFLIFKYILKIDFEEGKYNHSLVWFFFKLAFTEMDFKNNQTL